MIVIAVICTLIAGLVGYSLEPESLAMALPVAVMGGFILKAIQDMKN